MAAHRHVFPAGSTARAPFDVDLTPELAGWGHCGLAVATLAAGASLSLDTAGREAVVLPLAGGFTVACDALEAQLTGRPTVFAGPTDFAYLPRDATAVVASAAGGRVAIASARCRRRLSARHVPADRVPVELRGAGQASRQVNNFCVPGVFEADALIACEVLTPGGNWSSYPPHKHDEASATETALEEIYYFEVADGPAGPGMGYQRVYGHAGAAIDVLAEVRSGDVVAIPRGWHGPSMAAPGYDLYYLNVMAGPGERAWRITDDPAHGWVRDTWAGQQVDPRLPFGAGG